MNKGIRSKLMKLEKNPAGRDEGIRNIFVVLKELMGNPTQTVV